MDGNIRREMLTLHAKEERFWKLELLFQTVINLTVNHEVLNSVDLAYVSPEKLGEALAKVDPEWYKLAQ